MDELSPDKTLDAKIILYMLGTYSLWGANTVAIKLSLLGVPPFMVVTLRMAISLIFLAAWNWSRGVPFWARGREALLLIIFSILGGIANAAFILGTNYTSASRAAVFINSYPLFTVFFAHFFLAGDRMNSQKLMGSIVALAGLVLAFMGKGTPGEALALGDIIVIFSALTLAVRLVLAKRMVAWIHPAKMILWNVAVPIPLMALTSSIFEDPTRMTFPPLVILGIVYQGAVLGFFCHLVQATLLKYYRANTVASFSFLVPLYGVIYSIILLGDPLTWGLAAGAVLVALGIFIVNYSPREVKAAEAL